MARNNYFMRKLSKYVSTPPQIHGDDIIDFKGGLNVSKAPQLIDRDQSPDMVNLLYKNGGLYPRGGVKNSFNGVVDTDDEPLTLFSGKIGACCERPFYSAQGNPFAIFTADGKMFAYELEHLSDTGNGVELLGASSSLKQLDVGGAVIPESGGTFFEMNDCLYYKGKGCYVKIKFNSPWEDDVKKPTMKDIVFAEAKKTGFVSEKNNTFKKWLNDNGDKFKRLNDNSVSVYFTNENKANAKEYIKTVICREFLENNYFVYQSGEQSEEQSPNGKSRFLLIRKTVWKNSTGDKSFTRLDNVIMPRKINGTVYSNCKEAYEAVSLLLDVAENYFENLIAVAEIKDENGAIVTPAIEVFTEDQKELIKKKKEETLASIEAFICPADFDRGKPNWLSETGKFTADCKGIINGETATEDEKNAYDAYRKKLLQIGYLGYDYLKEMADIFIDYVYTLPTSKILETPFVASNLGSVNNAQDAYVPLVAINVNADGTGATFLQSENRISNFMRLKYNGDGESKTFNLPSSDMVIDISLEFSVKVDGEEVTGVGITSDYKGFTFNTAPPKRTNNIEVQFGYYKVSTDEDGNETRDVSESVMNTREAFMSCDVACVYGGGYEDAIVVFGGSDTQKNAIFWSGIGEIADPTYIPFDYYNLIGDSSEKVTAMGVQQAFLAIFSEHSVGRVNLGIENVAGLDLISLDYTTINSKIGCDIKNSVRLVENCLVFANTYGGIYRLQETSDYSENNVVRLSENINNEILPKLRNANRTMSFDDGTYYGLTICQEVKQTSEDGATFTEDKYTTYLWDYSLYHYYSDENTLAWFKWTDVPMFTAFNYKGTLFFGADGRFIELDSEQRCDYDSSGDSKPITFRYMVAPSLFKTYLYKKEILKVIFTCDTSIPTNTEITYITDYETAGRRDLSNIVVDDNTQLLYTQPFVRKPRAMRIHHMAIRLDCCEIGKALNLITVQTLYRYMQENR